MHPTPLSQDGLLELFKGDAVGRGVVLEPASFEDMCGGTIVSKKSLEVIYDNA
jgi:chlorophyllide a reductase subunit X